MSAENINLRYKIVHAISSPCWMVLLHATGKVSSIAFSRSACPFELR